MIQVAFINENKEITSNPVYQWDYGRQLHIYGLNITDAVIQVHFGDKSNERTEVRLATSENDYYKVSIPDVLLENSYSISAFIYSVASDYGKTTHQITIPVVPRKKPAGFISEPDPTQTTILEEALNDINEAYTKIVEIAEQTETPENAINVTRKIGSIPLGQIFQDYNSESEYLRNGIVQTAQKALYASDDKSKGTIEERLTALGFNEGVAALNGLGGIVSTNTLKKQGKYVLFELNVSGGVLGAGETAEIIIPDGFIPKDEINIICACNQFNASIGQLNIWWEISFDSDTNKFILTGANAATTLGLIIKAGWETL